jgi:hypothetical protein
MDASWSAGDSLNVDRSAFAWLEYLRDYEAAMLAIVCGISGRQSQLFTDRPLHSLLTKKSLRH